MVSLMLLLMMLIMFDCCCCCWLLFCFDKFPLLLYELFNQHANEAICTSQVINCKPAEFRKLISPNHESRMKAIRLLQNLSEDGG